MIIKVDGVTGEQLFQLQQFIGSDLNLYYHYQVKKEWCGQTQNVSYFTVKKEDLPEGKSNTTTHAVKLIDCKGNLKGEKNLKTVEYFDLTLEVQTSLGNDKVTPKAIIDKVWEILDVFPEIK